MVYRCLDSKESDLRGTGSPSGLIADDKPGRPPRTTGLFHVLILSLLSKRG